MKVLLQELRKSKGLSQNDLARLTDMSPQNIQRIEQGEAKSLTFKTLALFCKVLNCQPGDLLVYEDDPHDDPQNLINEKNQEEGLKPTHQRGKKSGTRNFPRLEHIHPLPNVLCEFQESA